MNRGNRIEVFKGQRAGEWFYRVVSRNGQTLCTSEAYTRERDAIRAARRFYKHAPRGIYIVLPGNGLRPI